MKAFWFLFLSIATAYGQIGDVQSQNRIEPVPPQDRVQQEGPEQNAPWFTDTLTVPIGVVMPVHHYQFNTYLSFYNYTGFYDSEWHRTGTSTLFSFNPELYFLAGITEKVDLVINPQAYYNELQGVGTWSIGDLTLGLNFQIYPSDKSWFPGVQLNLAESFPIGKWENLNPDKLFTDVSSSGSYETSATLVLYKVYSLSENHDLSITLSGEYTIKAPVRLRNLNAYGGGPGTNGRLKPGDVLEGVLSFQLSLTDKISLGIDGDWTHNNKSSFSGDPGVDNNEVLFTIITSSSESFTISPTFSYNFLPELGTSIGCEFTVLGRNTSEYTNTMFNLFYYF